MLSLDMRNPLKMVTNLVPWVTLFVIREDPMSKLTSILLMLLLTAALAAPAAAGTLYRYTTEDGSLAFTDDLKRVPERYRQTAQTMETGKLTRYARYSPADPAARARHDAMLAERLVWLREFNAAAEAAAEARRVGMVPEAVVRLNRDTSVRVPAMVTDLYDEGPLVIEEVRVKRPGRTITTHNTVVRQGDRNLIVVRPAQATQGAPNEFVDERDLLR
jgi:hypothetical protein